MTRGAAGQGWRRQNKTPERLTLRGRASMLGAAKRRSTRADPREASASPLKIQKKCLIPTAKLSYGRASRRESAGQGSVGAPIQINHPQQTQRQRRGRHYMLDRVKLASFAAAAAAGLGLAASPVLAQSGVTKDELKGESGVGKALSKFTGSKSKCVSKCMGTQRKTSGPYTDCFTPFGGVTATCVSDITTGKGAE